MIENKEPICPNKLSNYEAKIYNYKDYKLYGSKKYKGIFLKNTDVFAENVDPEILCCVQDIYERLDCHKITYYENYAHIPTNGLVLNSKPVFYNNYLNESLPVHISSAGFHLPTHDISGYKNLKPLTNILNKINKISISESEGKPVLLAQQVENIFPEIVYEIGGKKGINFHLLTIYLLKAIKELQNK